MAYSWQGAQFVVMRMAAPLFAGLLATVLGSSGALSAGSGQPQPLPPSSRASTGAEHADIALVKPINAPLPSRDRQAAHTRSEIRQARPKICFTQAETRENIIAHRLSDPVHALEVGREQGEALSARLCRWNSDQYVYEIHVLRRDGRVLRVYMNAQNGEAFEQAAGHERDKLH